MAFCRSSSKNFENLFTVVTPSEPLPLEVTRHCGLSEFSELRIDTHKDSVIVTTSRWALYPRDPQTYHHPMTPCTQCFRDVNGH